MGRWFLGVAAALLFVSSSVLADGTGRVEIREWAVPWEKTRPRDPFYESETSVWFAGQRGNYLGHLNPETGALNKVDLGPKAGPHNLVVGKDGIVWYAGNLQGYIGRYDPASGAITKIQMPHEDARDPHTLIFSEDESVIWFTLQGSNMVGRLTIASGEVVLLRVETARARPYGIRRGPDGTIWVVLFSKPILMSIDPGTLQMREVRLPREETRPRRLEVTSDGRVWYVDYRGGKLGVFDPETLKIREWGLPSGEKARPYGTALDDKGRIWLVETGVSPNRFIGFDTSSETFIDGVDVPSGGGAVRHMHYDAASQSVWFGTDANTIGVAKLP
jgi:virginiamycin B lyase